MAQQIKYKFTAHKDVKLKCMLHSFSWGDPYFYGHCVLLFIEFRFRSMKVNSIVGVDCQHKKVRLFEWFLVRKCSALWWVHEIRRTLSFWKTSTLYIFINSLTTGKWPSYDAHNSAVFPSYHRKQSMRNTTKLKNCCLLKVCPPFNSTLTQVHINRLGGKNINEWYSSPDPIQITSIQTLSIQMTNRASEHSTSFLVWWRWPYLSVSHVTVIIW